jgi:hypothetical protein
MRTSITINIMAKCNQLLLLFSLSYCDLKESLFYARLYIEPFQQSQQPL